MISKELYITPCTETVFLETEQTIAISFDPTDRTEIIGRDEDEEDL